MAAERSQFWRDEEILVDRDGIPHFTGKFPSQMREYRRRVLFAYSNLEGDGDDAEKEARDLAKKQSRFAKKLLDALHGESWKACEGLLTETDKLKSKHGYKYIFEALQSIEKVGVIKKTEALGVRDMDFAFSVTAGCEIRWCYETHNFEQGSQYFPAFVGFHHDLFVACCEGASFRRCSIVNYRVVQTASYCFPIMGGPVSSDKILLANQSSYTMEGIEKALRVSYYDIHERKKPRGDWNQKESNWHQKKGGKGFQFGRRGRAAARGVLLGRPPMARTRSMTRIRPTRQKMERKPKKILSNHIKAHRRTTRSTRPTPRSTSKGGAIARAGRS